MVRNERFRFALVLLWLLAALTWESSAVWGKPEAARGKAETLKTSDTAASGGLSVTHHTLKIDGQALDYTATAGYLPLKDDSGKLEANIFFVAYHKGGKPDPARPLTFAFNGGPGAAALWLHVGGLGPKRVVMDANGTVLPKTFRMTDNDSTWLAMTDLVFVDPVGTGYSRTGPGQDAKKYFEVQEDVRTAARFVRLFVTQNGRWLSPIYIAGESYGTTRAAGLVGRLQSEYGLYPRGVVLISTVLDFQTILSSSSNDLPYVLGLPSCTASAWYQKKLAPPLQADLNKTLAEVENWATGEYLSALAKGDMLTAAERDKIAGKLAAYTGLTKKTAINGNLRISTRRFARELLRDEGHFLGFMDARVVGVTTSRNSEYEPFDPAFFLAIGPFVATFNDYVRRELKFETALNYEYLSGEANGSWKWSSEGHYLDVTDRLAEAMTANTNLKVFNAAGLFDLTTPYFAQRYSLNHMGLEDKPRGNITFVTYPSGHQIYTSLGALKKLKADAEAFMKE